MDAADPVLMVDKLSHCYSTAREKVNVLNDVDFSIDPKQVVAVTGESGSGKTTLLMACGGMLQPTSGKVNLNGQNLFELSSASRGKYRASKIGFLFQTLELVPYLSLLDNVRLSKGVTKDSASQWLDRLGLSDRITHKPESLSHGQRQRAALARAIAHHPALVIADEPTGNLDETNSEIVFKVLRDFANDGGSVLVASHDRRIESIADRVIHLDAATAGAQR